MIPHASARVGMSSTTREIQNSEIGQDRVAAMA